MRLEEAQRAELEPGATRVPLLDGRTPSWYGTGAPSPPCQPQAHAEHRRSLPSPCCFCLGSCSPCPLSASCSSLAPFSWDRLGELTGLTASIRSGL